MKITRMKLNQLVLMAGLSLSTLFFSSCDKENIVPVTPGTPTTGTPPANPTNPPTNNTPLPPVTQGSLVKQFDTQVYRYDAQNRLVELSSSSQNDIGYVVEYENDKPVKLTYRNGNHLLYTYEGDKVVEAVQYTPDNKVTFRFAFEYDEDRLVKETTVTYLDSEQGHLSIKEYFYDAQDNMTDLVITWSPTNSPDDMRGPSTIKWGDYDDKPNPVPYANMFFYLPGVKLYQNNPGFRAPGEHKERYTYTYHASGMPKDRTLRLEEHPHLPPFTEAYIYQ
ncbi:hypothetical protein ACFS7Z_11845 [Pontibacter toksunensis]|uniref:YD repeat-containing protein n=1 Tax=Pontibacter toksunensis TaxID=1332631 RepID=A0ABW6BUU6_9BACT